MSNVITTPAPYNWANYERTGCNAIDLVAQCIGYHRQARKPLKAIILKPTSFDLFRAGMRVLMKSKNVEMEDMTEFTFDGTAIKRGNHMQFDSLRCEYYPINLKAENN